jgi:Ca2+-binding RTX toxin-like protein
VTEGDAGTTTLSFRLELNSAPTEAVSVNVSTNVGGATAGVDYTPVSSVVTFAAGQQVQFVNVQVIGDTTFEQNETVSLTISGARLSQTVTATGTITNDDTDPATVARSFTLATSAETLTGAGGADQFVAALMKDAMPAVAVNTLSPGDALNGAGGNDTLRLVASGSDTTNQSIPAYFSMTDVETVDVINASAGPLILDFANVSGLTTLKSAGNANAVTVNNVTSPIALELSNTGANATVGYGTAVTAATATTDSMSISLNAVTSTTASPTILVNGIENVAITTTGLASGSSTWPVRVDSDKLKSVSVAGDKALVVTPGYASTLDGSTLAKAATFNASSATGAITANLAAATINAAGYVNIQGGSAADSFTITYLTGDSTVSGGGGNDTLSVTALNAAASDGSVNYFRNVTSVETLRFAVAAPPAVNLSTVGASTVTLGAVSTTVLSGVASGNTVNLGATGNTVTVNVTGAQVSGNVSDALTIGVGANNSGTVTANGVETINLAFTGTTAGSVTVVDPEVTTVNVSGAGTSTLTPTIGGASTVTLNASGLTAGGVNDSAVTYKTTGATITGGTGADTIIGSTGNDSIDAGAGNDSIAGSAGNDIVVAGLGDDTITGLSGNDNYSGGDGNDLITGGSGNDTVSGGEGNDTISGGTGNDNLSGGNGDDRFDFAASDWTVGDTIDGGAGTNSLVISGGTPVADTAFTNVTNIQTFGTASGATLDVTLGAKAQIVGISALTGAVNAPVTVTTATGYTNNLSVTLNSGTTTNQTDVIDASATTGSLTVTGNETNIQAGDTFKAGSGTSDELRITADVGGGAVLGATFTGFESISLRPNSSTPQESMSLTLSSDASVDAGKTMTISAALMTSIATPTVGGTLVTISATNDTDAKFNITGSAGNDSITTGVGADTIDGGTGNDTLSGGAGSDSLVGGLGSDSLVATSGNDTLDGGDGIDTLVGGTGNDSLIGGLGNDVIISTGGGNDIVDGGDGDDAITGGTGNDNITGGLGNDVISTGGGNDTVDGGDGIDTITLGAGTAESVSGGLGNDIFKVDATTLTAADTLVGGGGSDSLTITSNAAVADTAFTKVSGIPTITADTSIAANIALGTNAQAAGIATITAAASTGITVTGAATFTNALRVNLGATSDGLDNVDMSASTAAVEVRGSQFAIQTADTIKGGSGTGDVLTITASSGNAVLGANVSGFETLNIVAASTAGTPVSVTLDDANVAATKTMTINASALTATGDTFTLAGAAELDGKLVVTGGSNADNITGGGGNDTIDGGSGNDTITGGNGADSLTGGAGNDVFTYSNVTQSSVGVNRDTIADFTSGSDKLNFGVSGTFLGTASSDTLARLLFSGVANQAVYNTADKLLYVDISGDGNITAADYVVYLPNTATLVTTDLVGFNDTSNSAGQSLTLTANTDSGAAFTGGAGNDTYLATATTLTNGDTLDGGAGTDSLSLGGTGTYDFTGVTLTSVETIAVASGTVTIINPITIDNQTRTLTSASGLTPVVNAGATMKLTNVTTTGFGGSFVAQAAGTTFTLGATSANAKITGGAGVDTVNVGGATATGTFTGLAAGDTIKATSSASIAGVNAGAATGADTLDFGNTNSVTLTMTQAQHQALTTVSNVTNTQAVVITTTGAVTARTGVESYTLSAAGNNITVLAGTNVTGGGGADTVTVSGVTANGTYTSLAAADTILAATTASIAGVNAGAATGAGILDISAVATINATMTVAQHNGFATINANGTDDTITLTDSGTVTVKAGIGTYSVVGGSSVTVSATNTAVSITGTNAAATTVTVAGNTVTGTYNLQHTADVLVATNGANITGVNAGALTTAESLDLTDTITMTAAQYGDGTTTGLTTGAIVAGGGSDQINISNAFSAAIGANATAVETIVLQSTSADVASITTGDTGTFLGTLNISAGGTDQVNIANAGLVDGDTNKATIVGFTAGVGGDVLGITLGLDSHNAGYQTLNAANANVSVATKSVLELQAGAAGELISLTNLTSVKALLVNGIGTIADGDYTAVIYGGGNAGIYQFTFTDDTGGGGANGLADLATEFAVELIAVVNGVTTDAFVAANFA